MPLFLLYVAEVKYDLGHTCAFSAETIWLNLDLIKFMVNFCEELFPVVDYAQIAVPSYPTGQIGCLLCSINPVCQ